MVNFFSSGEQRNPHVVTNAILGQTPQGPQPKAYRCLSFDGGSAALLTVLVIQQIEAKRPGFLAKTEVFAGTSSGSTTALVLASSNDPVSQLPALQQVWTQVTGVVGNSQLGYIGALLGLNALFSGEPLRNTLTQFLGDLKLKDLPKSVVAATFNMNPEHQVVFGPTALTNLSSQLPGFNEAAVDVALKSSASPLIMPALGGFIDGGLFANNPAMVAASQIRQAFPVQPTDGSQLGGGRRVKKAGGAAAGTPAEEPAGGTGTAEPSLQVTTQTVSPSDTPVVRQLKLLSIGGGRDDVKVNIGNSSWGYLQWVFNILNPLLVMNVFFQGGMEAVDFQGQQLLAPGTYFRLDPGYVNKTLIPFLQSDPKDLTAAANSKETKLLVEQACQWLDQSGWMAD